MDRAGVTQVRETRVQFFLPMLNLDNESCIRTLLYIYSIDCFCPGAIQTELYICVGYDDPGKK